MIHSDHALNHYGTVLQRLAFLHPQQAKRFADSKAIYPFIDDMAKHDMQNLDSVSHCTEHTKRMRSGGPSGSASTLPKGLKMEQFLTPSCTGNFAYDTSMRTDVSASQCAVILIPFDCSTKPWRSYTSLTCQHLVIDGLRKCVLVVLTAAGSLPQSITARARYDNAE